MVKVVGRGQSRLFGSLLLAVAVIAGCAKEREVKPIIPNTSRVAKSALQGTYLYLRAITDVQSPGKDTEWVATGMYMESNKLVQFSVKEKALEVVELDPQFQQEREARTNNVLASFTARNVDVLRKQNVDGIDTHEEEETETRNTWDKRGQIVVDTTKDAVDMFKDAIVVSNAASGFEIDEATGAINFSVTHRLKDDAIVTIRHSFLKHANNGTYTPKDYPRDLQRRFGFFKTTTLGLDRYGRITTTDRKDIGNRWDTTKPVVYYLSKNFPELLKPRAYSIFADWNASFRKAVGHDVLELRENSGQELGDLRYSMITYDASETALHKILGYGPSYTNPRTGEIVKADVILYGGSLKKSLYSERVWDTLLVQKEEGDPAAAGLKGLLQLLLPGTKAAPPTSLNKSGEEFLADLMSPSLHQRDAGLADADVKELAIPEAQADRFDRETVASFGTMTAAKVLRDVKEAYVQDHMKCITRLSEDSARLLNEQKFGASKSVSDDELEVQIFTPLLTHELGHTLGLRHNFEGSADEKHFAKAGGAKATSSSVMDYGFLASQEPQGVGSYDDAAIQVLYTDDTAKTKTLVGQNYFFCTDEHILDARNGLCNQFDTGANLADSIKGQVNRYYTSYVLNNVKGDRINFGSSKDYLSKIQRYLLPIRVAFDNAQAILTAAQGSSPVPFWYVAGQRVEADADSDPAKVMSIKVVDNYAVALAPGKWELQPHTVERSVDMAKVAAIVKDAQQAQNLAFQAFLGIILDAERPTYSTGDLIHDELQIRGTLTDKLFAMMMLYSRTPDPTGNGGVITPFRDLKGGSAAMLLSSLLANVTPVSDPTTKAMSFRLTPHDINVRQVALNLLWNELAVPGSTAGAREMLAAEKVVVSKANMARKVEINKALAGIPAVRTLLEKEQKEAADRVTKAQVLAAGLAALTPLSPFNTAATFTAIPDLIAQADAQKLLTQLAETETNGKAELAALEAATTPEQRTMESIDAIRSEIRSRMAQLTLGGIDDPTKKRLTAEIAALDAQRNKINVAYVNTLNDTFLKVPVRLELQTHGAATGLLVRDNLNRAEDMREAANFVADGLMEIAEKEMAKPEAEQKKELIAQAMATVQTMMQRTQALAEYISSERVFVDSMYRMYTVGNP